MNLLAVASPFPRDALRLRFRWGIKSARSVGGTDGALRTRKSGVTAVRGSGDCGDGITSHANSSGLGSDASHLQEVAKPDRSTVPPAVPWPSSPRDDTSAPLHLVQRFARRSCTAPCATPHDSYWFVRGS